MRIFLLWLLFFHLSLSAEPSIITHFSIEGAIGPASSSYLEAGLDVAEKQNAHLVLIELNTPGGLVTSMREMIQKILGSSIPIVVYVSPKGSHAASAGTFLIYAAHIAAMAPGTNLGAATPISLIPAPKTGDSNTSAASAPERKALNDAMAYIKSLAQLHDRNITWGIQAVKEAESLSAADALHLGVIDLIAENRHDLLNQLDGREVMVADQNITLHTANAILEHFEADWKIKLLTIITNPNIAFILLLLALYGIFFELMNPGGFFPGVIGLISGIFAMYALNLLPFNIAGLLLILLGIALMITEVFVSGFGILGLGGVAAFSLGALLLFDAETLGTDISIALIIAISIISLLFFILVVRMLLTAREQPIVSGMEEIIDMEAEVLSVTTDGYRVRCHGERWLAVSDTPLEIGQHVQVRAISGLTLHIKPFKE
ncbi:MAG: nodulation protein NfeD [Epsilonproteobacteria bacterium]|nr:MAG: nodulation protein NfeD [Campylobacterota bacterium]